MHFLIWSCIVIFMEISERDLKKKYDALSIHFNKRSLRLCAASDARLLGSGSIKILTKILNISRSTIYLYMKDLDQPFNRQPRTGRKSLIESNPKILCQLEALLCGKSDDPLCWTSKSTTNLAEELQEKGIFISQHSVWKLLNEQNYSIQSNRKSNGKAFHSDRDDQFKFISSSIAKAFNSRDPVIYIDTKKKYISCNASSCNCDNKGLIGSAPGVGANGDWTSTGIFRDTAEFVVESIRHWWYSTGMNIFSGAKKLIIIADCGNSNESKVKLWKTKLYNLAIELDLTIKVRHFPPAIIRWNKIEHQMFSQITESKIKGTSFARQVVINLIGNPKATDFMGHASLDRSWHQMNNNGSDQQHKNINITKDKFHGEWNYETFF